MINEERQNGGGRETGGRRGRQFDRSVQLRLLLCNSSSIEDVTQGVKWKVAAELYEAA